MDSSSMPRFEAMTTGALLDRAFRLYANNFALLLGITAVAYVPLYALMLLVQSSLTGAITVTASLSALIGQVVFIILWASIALPISTGAATYAISERYLGRGVNSADALQRSLKNLWTMSIAQLSAGARIMIGFILLIVPGILWSLSYSLIVPAVMVEGLKAGPSLKRSAELAKGYRGKVFAILLVINLLVLLLSAGVGSLAKLVLQVDSSGGEIFGGAIDNLITVVMTPLGIVANILLYYDLRIRKEGFDLEMLSRSFSPSVDAGATALAPNS